MYGQVFGGWLADRVGGKWPFGGGILICAVLTLLTPTAAHLHYAAVFFVRMVEGVFQGIVVPTTSALMARWTPREQTTRAMTLVFSGEKCGYIVGMLLGGFLSDHGFAGGWPSVFYVIGTGGCVWGIFWIFLCYSSPSTHPRISQAEREYLEAAVDVSEKRPSTPWRKIFTSLPLLACSVAHVVQVWGYHTLLNALPLFYYDVLGFNMTKNGLLASLPVLAAAIALVSTGQVADLLRSPGRLSTTTVRKIFCISGLLLSSVFVIVSGFLGCDRVLVVLSMMAAMACISTVWASLSVNPMDLSTTHAATLFGIMNTSAGIAFIGTPQTIGVITYNNPSRAQWQKVFYITAGIEWFGAIVYLLFASGKPQNWHDDANST